MLEKPDIVILITDQERQPRNWPSGLRAKLMPTWERLMSHGLTFNNAYCAATQCSPSRAVMFTGQYAPKNGVPTLDSTSVLRPCADLPNIGSVLAQQGYDVAFKGKWHLSFPIGFQGGAPDTEVWTEADIANLQAVYGLPGWTPPDAGNNAFNTPAARTTLGGGAADNDARFVSGAQPGETQGFGECVVDFLQRVSAVPRSQRAPFCLFVSLVNPHDIAYFPNGWDQAGYAEAEFAGLPVPVPINAEDPLTTKPAVQAAYKAALEAEGPLPDMASMTQYGQFYAYLHSVVDKQIQTVLDTLDAAGLTKETVIIRTADHGELGLSHGLREKAYSAYEEMIHIPLCISNPVMFPVAQSTNAMWSHVDLMATVCGIAGAAPPPTAGRSQLPVLQNPAASVRDSVLFAFDDSFLNIPPAQYNTHIRALRDDRYTYAVYFSQNGTPFEYELYDNLADPAQMINLLHEPAKAILPMWLAYDTQLFEAMTVAEALPAGVPWQPPAFSAPAAS